jgi:transcription factor SFP1
VTGAYLISELTHSLDSSSQYDAFDSPAESPFLPHVEQDILRDFSCCGVELSDLHALIRHYEEKHAAGVEEDDDMIMNWDVFEDDNIPVQPAPTGKPDIAELKRKARFSVMQNLARTNNSVFDFEFDTKNFKRTPSFAPLVKDSVDLYGSQWSSSQSSPIEHSEQSFPSTPVTVPLQDLDVNAKHEWTAADWAAQLNQVSQPQAIRKSRNVTQQDNPGVVSPENTIVVDKPYKCRNLGCDKAYKNMNGLKYHRMHGVCNKNNLSVELGNASPVPQTPPASGVSTPNTSVPNSPALTIHSGFNNPVIEEKKYSCEKCSKRYKNLNGLKYHKKASHKSVEDVVSSPFSLASGMSFSKLH